MKILNIDPTEKSPSVYMDTDGTLNITGKSILEHPEDFYQKIMDSMDMIDAEDVTITFEYEYFNTASARAIMKLLKFAFDFNTTVVWSYEEGDEDMQEAGEDYQEIMWKHSKMPFKFVVT